MTARILVIEDNPASLDLMRYLLEAQGYAPLTACDGEEGLEVARLQRPDLIICDIQLPRLSGFQVAQEIKNHPDLGQVALVAVTAFAMVGDRDRVLAAGFDGYISKPITPEAFVGQVESFLRSDQRATLESPPGTPAALGPPRATRNHRILVVDNEPVNLDLKRSILEPLGYIVMTAHGMAEALELARRYPPDLIISDVCMSGGSGFDFVRTAKADPRLHSIPFILITTTYQDEKTRAKGLTLGADRFLFRPLAPQALLAEIESCLSDQTESRAWRSS